MNAVDTAVKLLQAKKIRPSLTRIHILAYLLSHPIHPTVDQIYQALLPQIPTLSKTTVYNTLDLLLENKLVKLVGVEQREKHYDANTKDHGHFFCRICEKIYDFSTPAAEIEAPEIKGFQIEVKNVSYSGVCSDCRHKNKHKEDEYEKFEGN
ncbi:MAG: transcriptional repressor [Firmicutes bacterium]|nr:transcriptional repressor [Bacillota bacterium]